MPRSLAGVVVVSIAFVGLSADAQVARCRIAPFAGASSPAGAEATMRVVNDGEPCGVTLYGVPGEQRNPASGGTIPRYPKHGRAEFVGARLQYTPNAGFVGDDEFSAQAWAGADGRSSLQLKVHVKVQVVAK